MTLVQLTIMKVSLCQGIEKIVAEEEKTQVIEFRHLKAIELVSLPSLTCFCSSEKCDLKFPSLENLVVSDCLLMETFSEVQSAPNLRKIHVLVGEKDRWYWEGDLNSTLQKLSTDKVSFKHSKHLTITEDSDLEEIWRSKAAFQDNYFHSLKTLLVMDITKDHVIPSHLLPCLKNLEELEVGSCGAVEVIFDVNDIDTKRKGTVARLKKLTLTTLPNLSRVWKKNPQGIVSFPNLQEVSVFDCGQLASLFPSSLAINLLKLQTLEIQWCDNLVEIVEKEDALELGTAEMFKFPCLFSLLLYNLPLLTCFYPGKHRLECHMLDVLDVSCCPMLKLFTSKFHDSYKEAVTESQVSVPITTTWSQQPLFSVEEVVPKLKELTVNEESIILLSHVYLPQDLFCKLNLLQLCFEDENNKKYTFPFHFLHKVPSLEHLQVYECFGLMEIFPSQTLQYHEKILVRLRKLTLNNLPELDTIGLEHSWIKPYTKKLDFLKLEECPRLEKLVSDVVSFSNLKQLAVESCEEMKNLFTFSTAKSLVQLEILTVLKCESMKEIVKNEDEDAYEEIILGRLKKLKLNFLSKLVSFYSGNAMLQLPCLSTVTIVKCPKMNTFSKGGLNAPMFSGIKTSLKDSDFHFHNDLNSTVRWLHQHVSDEHSKHLTLADDSKLEKILHSKAAFHDNNFSSLKSLVVNNVTKDHLIPSQVLLCLKSLEELEVKSCKEMGKIFDVNDLDTEKKGIVSRLKRLTLDTLPNLKCVWNKNPLGIVSFPNLEEVFVSDCGELEALFPSSLARNLVKLDELDIENCEKLVDIVGKDDEIELETTKMFKFPCLLFLTLFRLPRLSCFYPGKHHLVCPLLETLDVSSCPKLKLFSSEFHDSQKESVIEIQVSSTITISRLQQPLFLIEKVVPKLKELTLNEESIILLSHANLPQDLFRKLNLLLLCQEGDGDGDGDGDEDEEKEEDEDEDEEEKEEEEEDEDEDKRKDTLPFNFLRKVPSLEHLKLSDYFGLTKIFPSKKLKVQDKILSRLKHLTLDNLKELKSIGLEHPWVKPYSERLESLELIECPQVVKLVSGAVSFMNMKLLHVTDCKRMEYLFTFSVAKSLVQLVDLSIENCRSIKEIVKNQNEDASHEIIFGWLKKLNLDSLPLLGSFYSGKAKLQFSRLKKVTLSKCPNMKTFSQGDINAPFFSGVGSSIGDFDLTFHDDLNTTIKNLCHKQVEGDSVTESTDRGSSDGDNYTSE
ncbi:uncharacterized protein HKW66_Vig0113180 [Vigna angularis]|uniref:Disease resistance protein At4g27190-like leucine-rich repeats domain-containing protein n=2 Tax=Phaseolus angularis TaxID=3914 RepID=A0A8T0KXE6_PHAAN|nr:uncharacterized protein HKW66_Vig0113180 [Vigna angularis]